MQLLSLVMSLPVMSLGLRFCTSRKAGVSTLSRGNLAASGHGLGYIESPQLHGWHWVGHFLPPLHKWLRKQSSGNVGPPFLIVKLSQSVRVITIEGLLTSGCGYTLKLAQDSCNGT